MARYSQAAVPPPKLVMPSRKNATKIAPRAICAVSFVCRSVISGISSPMSRGQG
jgi:hypothetical protein